MNKKAISPIIAIVILLTVTVSSASSAFFWLNKIQGQITGEEERFEVVSFELEGAEVEVLDTDFTPQNELLMFIQNSGEEPIIISSTTDAPTTVWLLKDANDQVICSSDWSGVGNAPICKQGCNEELAPGEIRKVILGNLDGMCNVVGKPTDSIFVYEIDFGGITKVESSFVR